MTWQRMLAVLLLLLALGSLLEDIHWAHIEWCHLRRGSADACRFPIGF